MHFEVDAYVEAVKSLPSKEIRLETADSTYFHFKTDIFRRLITYSTDKRMAANLVTIDADRAFEVIALNKAGEKPMTLESEAQQAKPQEAKAYGDLLGQDDLTRFDKKKKKKRRADRNKTSDRKPEARPEKKTEPKAEKPAGEGEKRNRGNRRNRSRNKGDKPAERSGDNKD